LPVVPGLKLQTVGIEEVRNWLHCALENLHPWPRVETTICARPNWQYVLCG
jgi:hypothetical protein